MGIQVYKLREIITQAQSERLVLPNFQREYTYNRSSQKELLLSLFCGIPVGTILTLTGPSNSFQFRHIGRKSDVNAKTESDELTFLLDGQQRMSTFWNALTDIYSNKSEASRNSLYSETHKFLHSRWFLKFKKDEEFNDDIWGLKTLDGGARDLQRELLPEELSQFLVYDNAIKGDRLNWGGELDFPMDSDTTSNREKNYAKYLRENWLLPIHLISDSHSLSTAVSRIATRRYIELFERFSNWINDEAITYNFLCQSDQELAQDVLGVDSQSDFDRLSITKVQEKLMTRQSSWMNRVTTFCQKVLDTDIGVIQLGGEALSKGHVIFDVINRSGVKLSTFDLFCASKPDLDVRSIVNRHVFDMAGMKDKSTDLVSDRYTNQLLNLLRAIHAHRKEDFVASVLKDDKIFSLKGTELEEFLLPAIDALNKAYQLVHKECGVPSIEKMPYDLRILPVAFAIFLNVDGVKSSRAKYVYWLSFFGGKYRESQNMRCYTDLKMVRALVANPKLPEEYEKGGSLWNSILSVQDYNDSKSLIPELENEDFEIRSSVKAGILQWILSKNPKDFPPNADRTISAADEKLEIHHIIPLASDKKIGESTALIRGNSGHPLNSILNLTYISGESNRAIGGMDFEKYSKGFDDDLKVAHCIPHPPMVKTNLDDNNQWNQDWLKNRHSVLKGEIITRLSTWHEMFSS